MHSRPNNYGEKWRSPPREKHQQAHIQKPVLTTINWNNSNISANRDVTINIGSNHENRNNIQFMHVITDWLSPINFHEVHKDVLEKVIPGTATWILSDPTFSKWVNGYGGALLGTGIPGAGKTCLTKHSSVVIEHLKLLNTTPDDPVAIVYIYCRHKDKLSTAQLLASLLRQLVEQSEEVLDFIDQGLYVTCSRIRTVPRQSELLKALQGAISLLSKVFLVVDALDELDELVRHDVVTALLSLHQSLFMTSRPIPLSTFLGLELKIQAPSSDFQKLIESQIRYVPRLSWLLKHGSLQPIYDWIEKKSQGMLLLAALQISSLSSKGITNIRSLETTLNAMPSDLNQVYEQILERIASLNEEEQSLAYRAILWVTYAARSLKVDELLEILSTDMETATFDRQACTEEEILLSVCLGLLHIEQETRTVHLIHYTAQEFLQGHEIMPFIKPHVFLADISAIYLSTRGLDFRIIKTSHDFQTAQNEHPFLDYAIYFLGHHTVKACTTSDGSMPGHVKCLFLNQACILLLHTIFDHQYIGHVQLIQFAAYYGLQQIFNDCISKQALSTDIQNSALFYACLGGQTAMVKKLLSLGQINIGYQTVYGATFLHAAAERGHADIARLLVWQEDDSGNIAFSGIDVNSQFEYDATALLMAAWDGHHDLAQLLLATPTINASIQRDDGVTPLLIASQNGHALVVQLLLGIPNVDVNATREDGATPLYSACWNGHLPVVQLLLDTEGIDVNAMDNEDVTPLYLASQNGHTPVVELLLGIPDINVNAKEEEGTTPLFIACEKGHAPIVQLLLGAPDIDVNAKKTSGTTPLYIACQNGHLPVVQLLLGSSDIDINASMQDGATALWIACQNGHESIVQLLISTPSIDINAPDLDGWTPLYAASCGGHGSVVQQLLKAPHINIHAKTTQAFKDSTCGDTAIQAASRRGDHHLVALFLAHEACIITP